MVHRFTSCFLVNARSNISAMVDFMILSGDAITSRYGREHEVKRFDMPRGE
jgi:hypothetical protein